jgi:polysaccharide export outer membrane protein
MIYLQDMRPEVLYTLNQRFELRIQPNDRLRIVVSARNPELAAPFNVSVGQGYQVGPDGEVRNISGTSLSQGGYLVDNQGNIDFPVLGSLRVEGLTQQEVSQMIRGKLGDERLVPDAQVWVEVQNFTIYIWGEVGSMGIQSVPDNRITLLEAITRAGGLSSNAAMDEVTVIRTDRRGKRMMVNDVRTVALFDSPSYYLQQNDIVYVKPKTATMTERENRTWYWLSSFLTLSTTVISTILLINYFKN